MYNTNLILKLYKFLSKNFINYKKKKKKKKKKKNINFIKITITIYYFIKF